MVGILRCAATRAARASAEHPESGIRPSRSDVPAVIVLRDEFEIDRAHGAVSVLDFQADIREDKAVVFHVQP